MQTEIHEGPREITEENVQYWSKHYKILAESPRKKALLFLRYNCLRYIGYDSEYDSKYTFICLPLNKATEIIVNDETHIKKPFHRDYNFSVYKICKNEDGTFECNCQAWQTKARKGEIADGGCNCSHVLALFLAFKCKKFAKGVSDDHLTPDINGEYQTAQC